MKKILYLIVVLTTLLGSVNAQDTIKLDDVSITSSRYKVTSNTAKTIRLDSLQTFSQETPYFFSKTPSILYRSDNGTPFGYSYLTLRGMDQNRINYTLNGIPLNDGEDLSVYTSNYTDILSSLRSIQIVRGAGISSNGASSYVGLVNMDLVSPFSQKSKEISITGGSFNSYRTSLKYSNRFGKWGTHFRTSITGTDGFKDYSSGRSFSTIGSIGWMNSRNVLKFNGVYGVTRNGQAWLPIPEGMNPRTNLLVSNILRPQYDNFRQGIWGIQFSRNLNSKLILNNSIYLTTVRGNYDFPLDSVNIGNLELNSLNYGAYTNIAFELGKLSGQTGITYNRYKRDHIGKETPYYPLYKNSGLKTDLTIYTKSTYKVNNLTLNSDISLRSVTFDYIGEEFSQRYIDLNSINYSFGASYNISKLQPYISYSVATREPTRTDIFGYNDNITLGTLANGVAPETVRDLEIGTKISFNRLIGNINFYNMNFKNEILSINQMNYLGIMLRKNVDRSYRKGLETDLEYSLTKIVKLTTAINISNNRVWLDSTSKEPILTPNRIAAFGAIIKIKRAQIGLDFKNVSQSFLESSNSKNFILPSYNLLDASIRMDYDKYTISIFANNLLNKNIALWGNVSGNTRNYFLTSGFNMYTTISYRF